MSIRSLFSDADLKRIREAIARAESSNAGEIVPYLVGRVDEYDVLQWRGATLGALIAVTLAGVMFAFGAPGFGWGWGGGILWIMAPVLFGAGLGYVLAGVPAIGRVLLTTGDIEARVQCRAEAAFLEEEVFKTRDHTGILIFLAIYEHRAIILADEGINRVVPDGIWQTLVDELVSGIREGHAVEAVCDTIEGCGQVLQEYRVEKRGDDSNELNNGLRIRER